MTDTQNSGVWGVWNGGTESMSYAESEIPRDVEYWENVEDAKEALFDRYRYGHWQRQYFGYVNKDREMVLTPAVGEDCEIWVWLADPSDQSDPIPDMVFRLVFDAENEASVQDGLPE